MARTYEQAKEVIETFEKKLKLAGAMQINWIEEQTFRTDSVLNWLVDFFYFNCNYINDYGRRCIENTTKVGVRYDSYSKDCSYPGARRSLGDLYRLALTHFNKDLKLIDVVEALTEIVEKQILIQRPDIPSKYKYKIYCTNCSIIHRRVFTISSLDNHNTYKISSDSENNAGSDEDNITKEDYLVVWKEHSKRRKEEEARLKFEELRRKQEQQRQESHSNLDDEVARKIQEILLANSEKSSLVKPSKKKLRKVA